jgi:hypothetical protein
LLREFNQGWVVDVSQRPSCCVVDASGLCVWRKQMQVGGFDPGVKRLLMGIDTVTQQDAFIASLPAATAGV